MSAAEAPAPRSKTLRAIEQRLQEVAGDPVRSNLLQAAHAFKNCWIDLGQKLSEVYEQKLYEAWGYDSFERYASAELHLRKDTAQKLLRSYTFVSHAKPEYLEPERRDRMPNVDVIDFISKKREREEAPPEKIEAFVDSAFENAWSSRMVSSRWRDLVGDDARATQALTEDKSVRVLKRAQDLAERLSKTLTEVPGMSEDAVEAVSNVQKLLHNMLERAEQAPSADESPDETSSDETSSDANVA